jgi:tetratricopeptide (TPR) repeat protein
VLFRSSESLIYHPYADYLLIQGRLEGSLECVERGAALDPLSPVATAPVVGHLSILRRWDEAIALADRLIAANPEAGMIRGMKASALWQKGDPAAAITEWTRAGRGPMAEALKRGYAEGGSKAAAREVARMLVEASGASYVAPLNVATWFARAGDVEPTLTWLEKAYEERSPFLLHINADPDLDFVRHDARFQALVKRIGFPESAGRMETATGR